MSRTLEPAVLLVATAVSLHCGPATAGGPGSQSAGTTVPIGEPDHRTVLVGAPGPEEADELFATGLALLEAGRWQEALTKGFDPLINSFQAQYSDPNVCVFCTRDPGSGMIQGLLAAANDGVDAVAHGPQWPDALFHRAYCLVELGDLQGARDALLRALELMPDDVMYLTELGHVYQAQQDWPRSLQIYQNALESAELLARQTESATAAGQPAPASPGGRTPIDWQTRSLRGLGFTYVELGQLDAAEEQYHRALALDPNDGQSQNELAYIAELRTEGQR